MSDLPEAGAKLTLDLSEWESQWASAEDTATSTLDSIPTEAEVSIDITVGDDSAIADVEALDGETISPELDTTESETSKEIRDGMNFLATVKAIEIAINVVGTALDFVKDMGALVVNPFLDVEDSVARINAQTGGTGIADLGQLIRDIQAADLGDSANQIADVIIQAKQLGLPIEEAATAALTFTHTWSTEDPTKVIDALGSAIQTGIVDNMQEASDLMAVFFQNGGNIGNDALQVVQSSAQSWKDMGLNMAEGLSVLDSLQNGTGATATEAQKMLQTFDDAFTAAAADPASQQAKLLKALGIDNPKEAGLALGADTINGFAEAFANVPADQQDLLSGLFFGKGGKKFTGAISEMTTQEDIFKDVKDAASDAATEIDNSLRGAIDDFVTEVNAKIAELLSSDKIDLPGKIKALKEGFQEAVDVLANGGTVGDALEVALKIPGLSDSLDRFIGNFERIVGNLEIAFLQVVATIQDITGHGKEAEGTRKQIKGLATGQMAFDIQLANADEIPTIVAQALGRGLSSSEVVTALETGVNESIAKGNYDQGAEIITGSIEGALEDGASPEVVNALAFNFTDKLKGAFDNAMAAGDLPKLQDMIAIEPNATVPGLNEAVAGFQKQLSDAFAPQNRAGDQGNPFLSGIGAGAGKSGATTQGGMFSGLTTAVQDLKDKTAEASDSTGIALDHIATSATTMSDTAGTAMDTTNQNMVAMALQAQVTDADVAAALTDNTVTTSFQDVADAADSAFPGVITWFQQTTQAAVTFDAQVSGHIQHLLGLLHDLQFLSAQVATGVQAALTLGAGMGGGGNVTTNNVTVNNTVPGTAAAAANGYAIGASLRQGG